MFFNVHDSSVGFDGFDTADDDPWVTATAQVSNAINSRWKTIGQCGGISRPMRITVAAKAVRPVRLDLEVFHPVIGEYGLVRSSLIEMFRPLIDKPRLGRLLLKTGDSTIFELKDLQPPAGAIKAEH